MIVDMLLFIKLAVLAQKQTVPAMQTRLAYLHSEHAFFQDVIHIAIEGHRANKLIELLCISNGTQQSVCNPDNCTRE